MNKIRIGNLNAFRTNFIDMFHNIIGSCVEWLDHLTDQRDEEMGMIV